MIMWATGSALGDVPQFAEFRPVRCRALQRGGPVGGRRAQPPSGAEDGRLRVHDPFGIPPGGGHLRDQGARSGPPCGRARGSCTCPPSTRTRVLCAKGHGSAACELAGRPVPLAEAVRARGVDLEVARAADWAEAPLAPGVADSPSRASDMQVAGLRPPRPARQQQRSADAARREPASFEQVAAAFAAG